MSNKRGCFVYRRINLTGSFRKIVSFVTVVTIIVHTLDGGDRFGGEVEWSPPV